MSADPTRQQPRMSTRSSGSGAVNSIRCPSRGCVIASRSACAGSGPSRRCTARRSQGHAGAPPYRIADGWLSDCAEICANLVSPAGVDRNPAQCHAPEMACPRDPCNGVSRTSGPRRHFLPVNGIATDCGVDSPPGLNDSPHERDMFLFDFAIVKLSRELLVCHVVLGNHHHA